MGTNKRRDGSRKFRRFQAGQQPSAGHENQQSRALEDLTRFGVEVGPGRQHFRLMRLADVLGQFETSDSQHYDQTATVQYFDHVANEFRDTDPAEEKTNLASTWLTAPHDAEELVWCCQTQQSGVWAPISQVNVRHAMTVADELGDYPTCDDEPNVYPIKFTKKAWTKAAGHQTVTTTFLDTEDSLPDDHVLNIFEGESSYLPIGTEIQVYHVIDRWYCYTCCGEICESSSSSSISISLSSNSSSASSFSSSSHSSSSSLSASVSSASSVSSLSSASSQSSLSSLSSASSQSSSSNSSSASSDSVSSASSVSESSSASSVSVSEESSSQSISFSSASSISVSGSSGFDCVTVVTSLAFDAGTCVLTYCTRQICFPAGLGIVVHDEVC